MVPRVRLSLTAAIRRCSNTDSNLCSLIANVAENRSSLLLRRQGNKREPSEDELTPTHSTQISRCLWSAVAQRWTVGLSTERARVRIQFASVSKHGYFTSLHDSAI